MLIVMNCSGKRPRRAAKSSGIRLTAKVEQKRRQSVHLPPRPSGEDFYALDEKVPENPEVPHSFLRVRVRLRLWGWGKRGGKEGGKRGTEEGGEDWMETWRARNAGGFE